MNEENKGGYFINEIIVLESKFSRERDLSGEILNEVNLNFVSNKPDENNVFTVELHFDIKGTKNNEQCYSLTVKTAGIFSIHGNPELSIKQFADINAPAIIFPFIREHVSNIFVKAGLKNTLLPPINFSALHKEKDKE